MRAHSAPARRPDHRRDRPRVPRVRGHRRPADRPREAHPGRGARALRGSARATELGPRLASVLEVIYLIFNEGYSATAGDDWTRPALCEEALRLGRILAELAPQEPEVHGLVALMEIQASRLRARVGPSGEPVLLLDQDRGALGPAPHPPRAGCARARRARSAARSGRTRCRPRSPPATRALGRPRRRTGRASPRSTTRSPSSPRPRWSS